MQIGRSSVVKADGWDNDSVAKKDREQQDWSVSARAARSESSVSTGGVKGPQARVGGGETKGRPPEEAEEDTTGEPAGTVAVSLVLTISRWPAVSPSCRSNMESWRFTPAGRPMICCEPGGMLVSEKSWYFRNSTVSLRSMSSGLLAHQGSTEQVSSRSEIESSFRCLTNALCH